MLRKPYPCKMDNITEIILLNHEIHAHRTESKPKPKNKDKQNSCPSQATQPSSDMGGERGPPEAQVHSRGQSGTRTDNKPFSPSAPTLRAKKEALTQ